MKLDILHIPVLDIPICFGNNKINQRQHIEEKKSKQEE